MSLLLIVSAVIVLVSATEAEGSDTVTRWDSFSESSECGSPYTRGPFATRSGWLPTTERVLGPYGTYFGRSLGEVRSQFAWWTVPGSGGKQIQVHRAMLPDLRQVTVGLNEEAARGRHYRIDDVGGFASRTVGGSHQMSRHALGLAIDINPRQNPYRGDNRLITNMPGWFVDVWRDAGFCWGGDWSSAKDPMHFSWMGPHSPGSVSRPLSPRPPSTSKRSFGPRNARHSTEFAGIMSRYEPAVADGVGNGAPDVLGIRSHPNGSVLDVSSSTYGYGSCSILRWFIDDVSVAAADHVVFADIDGDSGQDLIALSASGSTVQAMVAKRGERFGNVERVGTTMDGNATAFTGADFDLDGRADLWEATGNGKLRIWGGVDFSTALADSPLPSGAPLLITAGDRDGGDRPELFALYGSASSARIEVLEWSGGWSARQTFDLQISPSEVAALGAGDYDGDGRSDLQVLTKSGVLEIHVGNTSTGVGLSSWFLRPDPECDNPILLEFAGTFYDDEDSIFTANIETIAQAGVTKGCNPPFNDRFCPERAVTRGQMAAFLVRALDLTHDTHSGFTDVAAGSTFAADIEMLASAGITKGCNPPRNDRFCPEDPVTRGQMAAFLVRALGLSDAGLGGFVDVPKGNTFAADIEKLATAGITKGCNPPRNDRFCPNDPVTREMMAAFLDRAGLGA